MFRWHQQYNIAYHGDNDYDEGGGGGSSSDDDDDIRTDGWVLGYN